MARNKGKVLVFLLLFSLIGCGEKEILRNLSARESIEIFTFLKRADIEVDRESEINKGVERYSLLVPNEDYARAIQVLHTYGLPREEKNIENFTKSQSFVPDPPELLKARLDELYSFQIERLLSVVPGVLKVRAIVRSSSTQETSTFSFESTSAVSSSSGSIVIAVSYIPLEPEFSLPLEDLKHMVVKIVPGVTSEDIIILSKIAEPFIQRNNGDVNTPGTIETIDNNRGQMIPLWQIGAGGVGFHVLSSERFWALSQLLGVVLLASASALYIGYVLGVKRSANRIAVGEK